MKIFDSFKKKESKNEGKSEQKKVLDSRKKAEEEFLKNLPQSKNQKN
jgi:hypothetical protein